METSPSVTAIVVNHNRGEMLRRTVDSLHAQNRPPDTIVVVDNGSTDGSLRTVRGLHGVVPVELGENTGASGGFFHGISAAIRSDASCFLLLDSDVVLAPDCLQQLQSVLGDGPGAVGPKVYHWDSRTVLQEFGGWVDWETADLRRNHWRHDESAAGMVDADQDVDYVPACCLLTSRTAIERAGNFDPEWFLYWDDIDWCDRVRAAGLRVRACAAARVQHFGGGANKRNLVPVYYGWRNRLAFFMRFAPVGRRNAVLRAYFEDFLLARFTCESLGLRATPRIMNRAVEDALGNVRGRIDFSSEEIRLDPPVPAPTEATGALVQVHHVIGSATAELAAQPTRTLQDRFGKRMPAAQAWALRQLFEQTREAQLTMLLSRVSARQ